MWNIKNFNDLLTIHQDILSTTFFKKMNIREFPRGTLRSIYMLFHVEHFCSFLYFSIRKQSILFA